MMAGTFLSSRLPTNTVPLSPSVSERALAMPAAYTSMLKPGGSFSLAVGNLSGAAASGGGAIGASLAAASLSAGRPIKGEPGGSGAAAAGAAPAAGAAGCWAAAPNVNTPKKAPASNRLRGADEWLIIGVLPGGSLI